MGLAKLMLTIPAAVAASLIFIAGHFGHTPLTPTAFAKQQTQTMEQFLQDTEERIMQYSNLPMLPLVLIDEDPDINAFASFACPDEGVASLLTGGDLCSTDRRLEIHVTQGLADFIALHPATAVLVLGHETGHMVHGDVYMPGGYEASTHAQNIRMEARADDYGWEMITTLHENPCEALALDKYFYLLNPLDSLMFAAEDGPDHPSWYDRYQKGLQICLHYQHNQNIQNTSR